MYLCDSYFISPEDRTEFVESGGGFFVRVNEGAWIKNEAVPPDLHRCTNLFEWTNFGFQHSLVFQHMHQCSPI